MKALLRHSVNNPKGRLPLEMPEPEWLADLSGRTKVVAKPFYVIAQLPKTTNTCSNVDEMRLKTFFGYMIQINRMNEILEIVHASNVVVEHLFNKHQFYYICWCRPKQ